MVLSRDHGYSVRGAEMKIRLENLKETTFFCRGVSEKSRYFVNQRLFTIYLGKPVGSPFEQMVSKIQDCMVSFLSVSGVPFAQINSINRKTAAKSWNWYQRWLEETEHLEHSDRENRTHFEMFCRSRKFEKSCISFFPTRFSSNFKLNGKEPQFTTQWDKFVTQCNRLFVLYGDPEVTKLALHEIKILEINAT